MRFYYRGLPNLHVSQAACYPQNHDYPFVWVKKIEDASTDYLSTMQKTQSDLKSQHGLDSELVPVKNFKLMQQQYAIAVETDEHRLKKQTIVAHQGIYTASDEVLTAQEPGVVTFDGFVEVLNRDEGEGEDEGRR
jgi:hypothetical protein